MLLSAICKACSFRAESQLNAALLSCAFWLASQEHILKDQFHEIIYIFLVPFRSSKKVGFQTI
jgi:hypothetical protein